MTIIYLLNLTHFSLVGKRRDKIFQKRMLQIFLAKYSVTIIHPPVYTEALVSN